MAIEIIKERIKKFKILLITILLLLIRTQGINAADLHVHDVLARTIVEKLSRQYNINLIGSEKLKGNIDVTLRNLSADEIIKTIANNKNCHYIKVGGKGYIIEAKEKLTKHIIIVEPKNISAEDLKNALLAIIDKGDINIVPGQNKLVINASINDEAAIETMLKVVDKKVEQVNLEVCVIALHKNKNREVGTNWAWENESVDGNISFKKAIKAPLHLHAQPSFSALNQMGNAKIIARPNIMARNGSKAHILIGDRVPVLVETSKDKESKPTIEYEDAGISLSYTPFITKEGLIDATIKAGVSTPHLVPEIKAYRITTREAETHVQLRDGETLIIGGLMDMRDEEVHKSIPILGKIPILKYLFSHRVKHNESVELVIILKGTIQK